MKISFIGMSGAGKSYWSKQFEKKGFKRFCCDDLIEEKLKPELQKFGYNGIDGVAKWMGHPFEKLYKERSTKYLLLEEDVVKDIARYLEKADPHDDIVVDTTGSVIHIDPQVMHALANRSKIIYFHTPSIIKKQMYELFLRDPKPIIWGDKFKKKKNEDNAQALARCYEDLLEHRSKKYENFAYLIMSYRLIKEKKFGVDHFLKSIQIYDQI